MELNLYTFLSLQKNSKDLALTLDNARKLMLMGISKDLGKCRGLKKSDNRPCTNFVNRYKMFGSFNLHLVSLTLGTQGRERL